MVVLVDTVVVLVVDIVPALVVVLVVVELEYVVVVVILGLLEYWIVALVVAVLECVDTVDTVVVWVVAAAE